jgi:hypothetical protein
MLFRKKKTMSSDFSAESSISEEICAGMSLADPDNPFYTFNYVNARRLMGYQPYVLFLRQDGELKPVCTAFMKSHHFSRSLEITSLPPVKEKNLFWEGIMRFCRAARVSELIIESYASACSKIPPIHGEIYRGSRCEYIIDLMRPDLWENISSNHMRNIKRGLKADLQVRRVENDISCREHMRLTAASLSRRRNRGESVISRNHLNTFLAFIKSGAGEIFQAFFNGEVVSSVLVLRAEEGGYYQSAGTSPEGMKCGASHFLIQRIAEILCSESTKRFNLGGADPSSKGLVRFKTGFGTTIRKLEAAEFFLGNKIKKGIIEGTRLLRYIPKHLQYKFSLRQTRKQKKS